MINDYLIKKVQFYRIFVEFDQKLSILVVIFDFCDQILPIFGKIELFRYKFEDKFKIWVRMQIEIVATIDQTTGIEPQKSIKSQFEYDLDQILAWPRLDRISLIAIYR